MADVYEYNQDEREKLYPLVSDAGKRYRMIEGTTIREYESGAQWDEGTGRLLPRINGANAVQLQAASVQSRVMKAQDAVRAAVMAEIRSYAPSDMPVESFEDAFGVMAASVAGDVLVKDVPLRDRVVAFKAIQDASGAKAAPGGQSLPDGVAGRLELSEDAIAMLAEALSKR